MSPNKPPQTGHVLQVIAICLTVALCALGLSRQFGHLEQKVDDAIEAKRANELKHQEQDRERNEFTRRQDSTDRDVRELGQWVGYPPPPPAPRRNRTPVFSPDGTTVQ